jgi:6-phosphogluconolactonase
MTAGLTETLSLPAAKGAVRVHVFDSPASAGAYIADDIAARLKDAVAQKGGALWIGCGGSTPKPIYQRLVEAGLDWDRIRLFQVDERFVPTDDAASNTRMMRDALSPVLSAAGKPGMELVSLIEDISDQTACAAKAEQTLLAAGNGQAPEFDYALMGMGPDAHYASIFPGHPINDIVYTTKSLVLPVAKSTTALEPQLPRITLSVPAINASKRILFYITGQTKLNVLKAASLSTDPFTAPVGAFLAQSPSPVEFVWTA